MILLKKTNIEKSYFNIFFDFTNNAIHLFFYKPDTLPLSFFYSILKILNQSDHLYLIVVNYDKQFIWL